MTGEQSIGAVMPPAAARSDSLPAHHADRLRAAVAAGPGPEAMRLLAAVDATALDEHDRVVLVQAWAAQEGWLVASRTAALVAFAGPEPRPSGRSSRDPAVVDEESVVAEVACALRVARGTAAGQLATARCLHGPLRAVLPLLQRGEWGFGHLRVAEDELTAVLLADSGESEESRQLVIDAVLDEVLPRAAADTPGRLRRRLRTAIARLDAASVARRAERAARGRKVVLEPQPDIQGRLSIDAPWAQVAWIHRVVDTWARRQQAGANRGHGERAGTSGQPACQAAGVSDVPAAESLDGLRVDGFTEAARLLAVAMGLDSLDPAEAAVPGLGSAQTVAAVAAHLARSGAVVPAPDHARARRRSPFSHALVVLTADTLLGAVDDPGWVPGYGAVPAAVARALAADAEAWTSLFFPGSPGGGAHDDGSTSAAAAWGRTGHAGPTSYRPSAAVRRAVVAAHGTCAFPGCDRPAVDADLDHVAPFDGRNTLASNLQPLCRRDHRLKTHGGWDPGGDGLPSPVERRLLRAVPSPGLWGSPRGHLYRADRDPPWDTRPPEPVVLADLAWPVGRRVDVA